jgi:hypothetical protein
MGENNRCRWMPWLAVPRSAPFCRSWNDSRRVTEHVAMKISWHRTSEVFRRYDIISGKDLADAAKKLESAAVSQSLAKTEDAQETQSQPIQQLRLQ